MARASYANRNPFAGRTRATYTPPPPKTPAPSRAASNLQAVNRMQQTQLRQMPDRYQQTNRSTLNTLAQRASAWWNNQMANLAAVNAQRAAAPYTPQWGVREQVNLGQRYQPGRTMTQMPDRVVQVPRYNTPVTYSTPINLGPNAYNSGWSPTMLPDQYFNMQQRVAGSQGLTGMVLPDTLQGQADSVYNQWTGVPTTGPKEGGKSKAGTYDPRNRTSYGGGGGYGGGWDYGGGGGGYKDVPDWYQLMTTWSYG